MHFISNLNLRGFSFSLYGLIKLWFPIDLKIQLADSTQVHVPMIKSSLFLFVDLDENHHLRLPVKDIIPLWLLVAYLPVEHSHSLIASTSVNPTVLAAISSMPDREEI